MSEFSDDLDFLLEKIDSEYYTYPLVCLYNYIKSCYNSNDNKKK